MKGTDVVAPSLPASLLYIKVLLFLIKCVGSWGPEGNTANAGIKKTFSGNQKPAYWGLQSQEVFGNAAEQTLRVQG